jgi:crotonobetainyl-CoA:carnitine CoA-transferase CaiB-like acyl-CoA transferase
MVGALDGIRVLDLSRVLAGPYCAQALGELGATVIKVEPPGLGDDTRGWGPEVGDGESAYFLATNRNKRGIVVDLKSEAGREVVRRLADGADVLVENFRPGTLERWGLGHEDNLRRNPRLIHLAISGFGQTGRYRDRAGYDLIAQGMGGLMSVTGEPDGPPVRAGFPVADLNAGTWGIVAVLAALHARHGSGRGQYLDVSLLESQIALHVYSAGMALYRDESPGRHGSAHQMIAPYQAYRARDGWLNVAVGSEKLWRLFCEALNLGIADDPRFRDNLARVRHREALNRLIEPVIGARSIDECMDAFGSRGIPAGPINDVATLYADPWMEEREQIVRMPHPTMGTYLGAGFPVRASGTPAAPSMPPPLLGQHTREVLSEHGYSPQDIDALLETRAVAAAPAEPGSARAG